AEESAVAPADDRSWDISNNPTWFIAPIDGTTNFAHGLPIFCVSIGIAYEGRAVVGAIYSPLQDEHVSAAEGQGGHRTPQRRRPLTGLPLADAIVGMDWAQAPQPRFSVRQIIGLLAPRCRTTRVLGSAALGLAYVALGRVHLYTNVGLKPWDIAAGAVILREVGADIQQPDGSRWQLGEPAVIAAHPALLAEVAGLVRGQAAD
ncbi:MAG: hypothetical protein GYB68_05440, partial [Chloroflexi bacterium]|nr:hypothetical protein [Chloroflexota bacterium]